MKAGRICGCDRVDVKSVRFSQVVKECGKPEIYLLLEKPARDRTFRAAAKGQRVMTVFQESTGTKADRGKIGFEEGRERQYLVFPKTLKNFAGLSVIGIRYDLLDSPDKPQRGREKTSRASKKPKQKSAPARRRMKIAPSRHKVIAFERPAEKEAASGDNDEIEELKRQVRHAMGVLEEGKAVAAFNLLKRIVE